MDWKEEPKAIKKALQGAGFTVLSARKGTGTARAWNIITVSCKYNDWRPTYNEANAIAESICGHSNVNINVI